MPRKTRRGMEEEWLNEPEGSGEVTSPEGDVPPWASPGYKGYFPLQGKVFYIVAFVGDRPHDVIPREEKGKQKAIPLTDVGEVPRDVSFGSKYMMMPFAAVPVRPENEDGGRIIKYLVERISSLGKFGKIVRMTEFPTANVIQLFGSRWFPVAYDHRREWNDHVFGNAYSENKLYGGPEEGGWYYDAGLPIASIPSLPDEAESWIEYLAQVAGWASKYPVSSVLGHDNYEARIEPWFAEEYPSRKPRYE